VLTGALLVLAVFMVRPRKPLRIALTAIVVLALAYGVYTIFTQLEFSRIESLTKQYSVAMQPSVVEAVENERKGGNGTIIQNHLEYFKVFDVVGNSAKVLVVTSMETTGSSGYVYTERTGWSRYMKQQEGTWEFDNTKPIEVVENPWPPYY
jgi:hypothetical protein